MIDRIRNNQLWQLILANVLEKVREPGVLFWGIGFPILMSIGLGLAFTRKPESVRHVALISADTGTYSIVLKDDKLGNTTFQLEKMPWEAAMVQLKRGHVNVAVTIGDSGYRYHFDPMNPDAQLTYVRMAPVLNQIPARDLNRDTGYGIRDLGSEIQDPASSTQHPASRIQSPGYEEDLSAASATEVDVLTVTGTRYIDFLIPGMIAMGVMFSCLWGLGYYIIDTRSKKLLRRMIATPMKRSNYLIAMITVRLVMNVIEAILLVLFAWLAFGITIQGNIPALLVLFLAGNIAFSGIGIFLACHTSKTEIGNAFINVVSMPMMILSGIFFSYHNFPDWAIPIIQPLPLTMLADGIRSIFIEGAGFAQTAIPSLILTLTGVVFFTVGLKLFKWH
ncbi:MAG: ABC transporter permease [Bacteroidales bacterium]|nr:ABC transporter permease [Bacteroidales bacterium]